MTPQGRRPDGAGRRRLVAASLLAIWSAMVWNDWSPVVRLDSPALNAASLLASFSLPWFALGIVLWGSKRLARITALGVLAVPLLYTLVFGPLVFLHLTTVQAEGGNDTSFELLTVLPVEGGRIAIYRTDCGATCAVGITVRQERRLVWRLLLVRHLGGFARADEARYELLGPRRVRISVPPDVYIPGNQGRSGVYDLKPWVYF